MSIILTQLFAIFVALSSFLKFQVSGIIFLQPEELTVAFIFRVGLLVTNSLSRFFLIRKSFHFVFIPEGYFCWILNSGLIVLSFQHFKDVVPLP